MMCECRRRVLHVKIIYLLREVDCAKGVMEGELDAREDTEGCEEKDAEEEVKWNYV